MTKLIFPVLFCIAPALVPNVSFAASGDCRSMLIRSLAENIYENVGTEDGVIISSDSLVEFFTQNVDVCKEYLLARTYEDDVDIADNDLTISIRWEYILDEVAAAMTISSGRKNLFICENDRSYQAGIDGALWAATGVSALFSFGTGGAAIQGAKVGITQAAKNLLKIGVKKGVKTTAVEATAGKLGKDIVGKTAEVAAKNSAKTAAAANFATQKAGSLSAKKATEATAKAALNEFKKHPGTIAAKNALTARGIPASKINLKVLETELKNTSSITTKAITKTKAEANAALDILTKKVRPADAAKVAARKTYKNALATEVTGNAAAANALTAAEAALVAETAAATSALNRALVTFAISTPLTAAGGMASVYSFLESGFDPKVMNCTNTDKNTGCYLSCSKDNLASPADDLNTKVFQPLFGKSLCIDENANYVLREIQSGMPMPGDIFVSKNDKQWAKAKQIINEQVKDKGNCDWSEDDVDLYVGAPMYDPATLEPQADGVALIVDGVRLDD